MKTKKSVKIKKAFIIVLFLIVLQHVALFAQAEPLATNTGNLAKALGMALGFFSSGYMRAILSIALGGLAIGLISNRGEPGAVKKFIPWIAACVLLLALGPITKLVFPSSGTEIAPDASAIKNI